VGAEGFEPPTLCL